MHESEKHFWGISPDLFVQHLETDSFIYRYYVNSERKNLGLFYDKLTKRWDTAYVTHGRIITRNINVNKLIHQLEFAA